jgi:hypothetical protein
MQQNQEFTPWLGIGAKIPELLGNLAPVASGSAGEAGGYNRCGWGVSWSKCAPGIGTCHFGRPPADLGTSPLGR